ncbi:hypothetical protein ACI68E_001822 [Malassezia pachydermatis]|uniref:Uncharacterized protein n=1 Tax=Malassezia pachydermatis TaxID=77020 RepID=A0A0M9VRE2_9BASI|nr:hypothetical protein Malapachy_2999 [Malassezia pachydermatis]KOS16523.1 hypothetical protein Malapachy_2999 [Malassezia pachydermatis]
MRIDVPATAANDVPARQEAAVQARDAEDDAYEPLTSRQRSSLNFLRMNTPVSLLCCITTALITALIVPSIHYVFRSQPTYFTMAPRMMLAYFVVLMLFETGFCVFALISRNLHSQHCIVQGVGSRLAFQNYLLAIWLFLRVMDTYVSMGLGFFVLLAITLMAGVNGIILQRKFPMHWLHPFETLLVHVPNALMAMIAGQVLIWDQLMLWWGWDRSNGRAALAEGLVISIIVEIVLGIGLAVWVGMTSDVAVYAASMFLDAAVLKFHKMPVIGPNSRPFALTVILCVSMTIRTLALVVPSLLHNGFLIVCHTHRRHTPEAAYENPTVEVPVDVPAIERTTPRRVEAEVVPAPADSSERTRLVVKKDPTYGSVPPS